MRQGRALLGLTAEDVGLLDIGANLGLMCLPFSQAGRPVHAIEANPLNAKLLRESAQLNGFSGLRVHEFAVSDKSGEVEFHPSGPFGAIAGDHFRPELKRIKVKSIRLDDWTEDIGSNIVVKMDIEGSEVNALNGMRRFLARRDYPPLFVESNPFCLKWFHATPGTLMQTIGSMGYEIHVARLTRWFPWRAQFRYERPTDPQRNVVENLLCVRAGDSRVRVG